MGKARIIERVPVEFEANAVEALRFRVDADWIELVFDFRIGRAKIGHPREQLGPVVKHLTIEHQLERRLCEQGAQGIRVDR